MPVPPDLPVHNATEVKEFRALFLKEKGVLLSEEEAIDQCRRLVRFVFLMEHAMPYLLEGEEKSDAAE